MRGNSPVRFLGEGASATMFPYPTEEKQGAMRSMRQASSTVLAAFFAIVTLAGCSSSKAPPATPPTPDVQVSSAGWGYGDPLRGEDGRDRLRGCRLLDLGWGGRPAVWIDHDAQTKGGLEFTTGKEAILKGSLLSREGKPLVEISWTTGDGKAGRLTIGGQELDLAGGWLVLVATEGEQLRVKQLKRPALTDTNGIRAMRGEPEIIEFFAPKSK